MKTCSGCHVTKASECFYASSTSRCITCKKASVKKRSHRMQQTTKGRLNILYHGCKTRHNGCKTRHKSHEGELITLERFEAIYQAQGGVCVETGVPFDFQSTDLMPSPDRIDNAVGYTDGNIRFVTWRINQMRRDLSAESFQATCVQVIHHNKRKFDAASALLMLRG